MPGVVIRTSSVNPPMTPVQLVALQWAMHYLPTLTVAGTTGAHVEQVLCSAFRGDEESAGGWLTTAVVRYREAVADLRAAADSVADLLGEGE